MLRSDRYDDYGAQNDMFALTSTKLAPWTVINSNDKRTARVNVLRHVLHQLPYEGKDGDVVRPPDPSIVASPQQMWPELR